MTAEPTPLSNEIYRAMAQYHGREDASSALETARHAWGQRDRGEPLPGDDLSELGEIWRLAMLACTRAGRQGEMLVWRARSLAAFVRSGCRNGAAMLCLPLFFQAVADEQASPEEILDLLDVMASLADHDGVGPLPATEVVSSVEEKRGYFLSTLALSLSDTGERGRMLEMAADAYETALDAEGSDRRRAKIEAASATVEYLRAGDQPDARKVARDRLARVVARIETEGIAADDVARIGAANLEVMDNGGQDLDPYEIR